jgi:hypothetical protein
VVELISRLFRAVWLNPQTSVQDGLLIAAVMLVSSLLALQYNLFFFIAELSEPITNSVCFSRALARAASAPRRYRQHLAHSP